MNNVLIYPGDRRARSAPESRAAHTETHEDPLMGLGWLIAAVGFLCMLSAIALATLNLA